MRTRTAPRTCVPSVICTLLCAWAARGQQPAATPERAEALPPELEGVGIDEHLNAQLPLDLEFTDHAGKKVRLRDYFDGQHPVVLTLNYYKCPMLCGLMLNGLLDALRQLDWTAGEQFQVVTISFDPLETYQLAAIKRRNYLAQYERPAAASGWPFLVGRKASIDPLLEASGYRIRWNEKQQQWMHITALIICTPDGRISRYLYGVLFEPKTLRLSLVEASQGKIGSTLDRVLLYCYHYEGGTYTLTAMNIVRAGGMLTLLVLGTLLIVFWRRERRRTPSRTARPEAVAPAPPADGPSS
jgi:protein SCO1/2